MRARAERAAYDVTEPGCLELGLQRLEVIDIAGVVTELPDRDPDQVQGVLDGQAHRGVVLPGRGLSRHHAREVELDVVPDVRCHQTDHSTGTQAARGLTEHRAAGLEIGRAHVELQSLMRTSYAVFC